jgi:hypothetical protein
MELGEILMPIKDFYKDTGKWFTTTRDGVTKTIYEDSENPIIKQEFLGTKDELRDAQSLRTLSKVRESVKEFKSLIDIK